MSDDKDCSRQGCDNTYCNRYSPVYNYICYQCFEELESTPDVSIRNFMSTPARIYSRDGLWGEYVDSVFEME